MKAEKLRIGNWVLFTDYPNKRELQITGNDITQVEKNPKYLSSYFSPIPLTEEWLIKFGFKETQIDSEHLVSFENGTIRLNMYKKERFARGLWLHGVFNRSSCPIQYVHQLQNLYFALTGEELTIKQ